MKNLDPVARSITQKTGETFQPTDIQTIGGGCINSCARLSDGKRSFFVKLNDRSRLDMFLAEARGLKEINDSGTIRAPRPVISGATEDYAYLVMEFIDLGASPDMLSAGSGLAGMHRVSAQQYGWNRDNTIGATPQPNAWTDDWIEFWHDKRLGFQLQRAADNGYRGRLQTRGEKLLAHFARLIDHSPLPSLLHGDLWGGNIGFVQDGAAIIFDPAVYYGDREADIAMTELFGGFGADFYRAYEDHWPLDEGYRTRRTLYNLYHILNHLNLFGGGYGGQALSMIDRLLAELGH